MIENVPKLPTKRTKMKQGGAKSSFKGRALTVPDREQKKLDDWLSIKSRGNPMGLKIGEKSP